MGKSNFNNYKNKTQQFAKKQFDSWAYNQGLNMADQTIKSVAKDVQEKIFSKNSSVDTLPVIDIETDLENISDANITDIVLDSTTNNSLWLVDKGSEIALTFKDLIDGKISRADCIEKIVKTASAFIGKIVKGVTIVALGVGNFITLGFFPIPIEWVGHLAGAFASELFCAAFQPLVNHLRKKETHETYKYLHGFYEASINELRRQRELFEGVTAEFFFHRKALIDECTEKLDGAFVVNDGDEISKVLSCIAQEFGAELKFKNFEEFDAFMLSDEELVI